MRLLLALWILLIAYLSLYPFHFAATQGPLLSPSLPYSAGDWVDVAANLMFYAPVGYLGLAIWKREDVRGVVVVWLLGTLLSLGMELAQAYLPTRYSSLTDLACNGAGTLAGCLAYRRFKASRLPITPTPFGWILIGCWMVWQLYPLIPAFRRWKLAEIYSQMGRFSFHGAEFMDIFLAAIVLYALTERAGQTRWVVCAVLFPVLLMQSVVMGLTYSNLRLIAAASGVAAASWLWRPGWRIGWIVLAAVLAAWTVTREVVMPVDAMAPFVRVLAGRVFYGFATLAVLAGAVRPILFSRTYVYSNEQGGPP